MKANLNKVSVTNNQVSLINARFLLVKLSEPLRNVCFSRQTKALFSQNQNLKEISGPSVNTVVLEQLFSNYDFGTLGFFLHLEGLRGNLSKVGCRSSFPPSLH